MKIKQTCLLILNSISIALALISQGYSQVDETETLIIPGFNLNSDLTCIFSFNRSTSGEVLVSIPGVIYFNNNLSVDKNLKLKLTAFGAAPNANFPMVFNNSVVSEIIIDGDFSQGSMSFGLGQGLSFIVNIGAKNQLDNIFDPCNFYLKVEIFEPTLSESVNSTWYTRDIPICVDYCEDAQGPGNLKVNAPSDIDINIYPNPATNYLNISSENLNAYNTISIINNCGKELLTFNAKESIRNKSIKIDLRPYPKGVYFVRIQKERAIHSYSIIKK